MAVAALGLLSLCGRRGWDAQSSSLPALLPERRPEEHTRRSGLARQLRQGHLFLTPRCEMFLLSLKHLFSRCEALLISEEDILLKNNNNNTLKTSLLSTPLYWLLLTLLLEPLCTEGVKCSWGSLGTKPPLSDCTVAGSGYCQPLKAFDALKWRRRGEEAFWVSPNSFHTKKTSQGPPLPQLSAKKQSRTR